MIYLKCNLKIDRLGVKNEKRFFIVEKFNNTYDKIYNAKKLFWIFYIKSCEGFLDWRGNFIKRI